MVSQQGTQESATISDFIAFLLRVKSIFCIQLVTAISQPLPDPLRSATTAKFGRIASGSLSLSEKDIMGTVPLHWSCATCVAPSIVPE